MSPSDKNKSTGNSSSGEGQSQLCSESCEMNFQAESTSPSTSNVTLSGHGSIVNIPWVTASQSTIKCSVNDQMKTFDPGEGGGIERLTSTNSGSSVFLGKSCSSLIKNSNNKNYKAGSKINKLADMLAKRSQNVVEVKQNTSDITVNINSAPKLKEETVVLKSVSNDLSSENGSCLENTTVSNEVKLFRKSRRKSVPNQSYSLQHWQSQSTSKSCSDISELFPVDEKYIKTELNALQGSMSKLETDESTKKKAVRTNSKSAKLPLDAPDKKRRSSCRSITISSSKTNGNVVEKNIEKPLEESSIKSVEKPVEIPTESLTENLNEKPTEKHKKHVEKPKEQLADKLTEKSQKINEKPLESVIEKAKEKIIEKPVEILVEKSKDKPAEKSIEKPTDEEKHVENFIKIFDEHSVDKSKEKLKNDPKEKSRKNSTDKPMDKLKEKSRAKSKESVGNFTEKSKDKTIENSLEKSMEKSVDKSKEKLIDNYIEKGDEMSIESIIEKPAEKSEEKPVDKFKKVDSYTEKAEVESAENLIEKRIEKPIDKTKEKLIKSHIEIAEQESTENLTEKPSEKSKPKPGDKSKRMDRFIETTVEKSTENLNEKSTKKSKGKSIYKSKEKLVEEKSTENLTEKPREKSKEKSEDKSKEKVIESHIEKVEENPNEKSTKNSKGKPIYSSREKLVEEKSTENLTEKPGGKSKEKSKDKSEEKIFESHAEKAEEISTENPHEKPTKKPTDNLNENLAKKSTENLNEKTIKKFKEKPVDETKEKPIDSHMKNVEEISRENLNEKSTKKSTEKLNEKPTRKSTENLYEKPPKKSKEKSMDKTKEKLIESNTEKVEETSTENLSEKPSEKSKEKPVDKTKEKLIDCHTEKVEEKSTENLNEKPKKKLSGHQTEKSKEKFKENCSEVPVEETEETVMESSKESFVKKPKEKSKENSKKKIIKEDNKEELKEKQSENSKEKRKEKTVEKLIENSTDEERSEKESTEITSEKIKKRTLEKTRKRTREISIDDDSPTRTESLRKTRERSCKKVHSVARSPKHGDNFSKRKEVKTKQRKSKRLVESSTQTADIEFISVIKPSSVENDLSTAGEITDLENFKNKKSTAVETDKPEPVHEKVKIVTYECLYCTQTFTVWALCKAHEKTHAPRKYKQFRCQYCSKKLFSLEEFKNHCIQKHRNKYAYCKKCDFRFSAKDELYSHNKEIHLKKSGERPRIVYEKQKTPVQEIVAVQDVADSVQVLIRPSEEMADNEFIEEKSASTILEGEILQNFSEVILLEKVCELKIIQNSPEITPVEEISEEIMIEKTSEDEPMPKFSEEEPVQSILEERDGEHISKEKEIRKVSEEKATKKFSDEKEVKKVADESVIKKVSEETVIKKIPDKSVIKNVADESVIKKVAHESVIKKVPDETLVKEVADEKVVRKVADEKVIKKVPHEKIVKKVPHEKIFKKAPGGKVIKMVPEEKMVKMVPEEKMVKMVPDEKVVRKVPEEKGISKVPDEKMAKKVPEERVAKKVPEDVVKIVPDEKGVKKVPDEKLVRKVPEEKGVKKVADDKVINKVPDEKVAKKVPEEKVVKIVPEEKGVKKVPDEKVARKVPEEKGVRKVADDKVINKVPDEKVVKKVMEEKSDKKIVEEKTDKKTSKSSPKTDLRIDVSFDTNKKSSVSPRNSQRCSPKEKTEEQILEMEMLFYSHLSGNIQENLTNHLDGKIDQNGTPVRIVEVPENTKNSSLLSVATPSTGTPDVQVLRAPSPYQTRSKTPNPLPPTAKKFKKLPNWQQKFWEKYNFPTNYRYQHRFWDKNYLNTEKPAFYLKDLSCLDIKTQLTMRDNIKKLDEIKKIEENTKPADVLKFPDYLSLVPRANKVNSQENRPEPQKNSLECFKSKKQVGKEDTKKSFKSPGSELPLAKSRSSKTSSESSSETKKQFPEGLKMVTRRQSSLESSKEDKEDGSKKRKGSLDLSGIQRMALRRQTSLDNIGSNVPKAEKNDQGSDQITNNLDLDGSPLSPTGSTEISGEWVRPRSYLCGTCCTKFTNLWELEDHKWVSHPNVWCTHYEFEDEKIDKLFQKNEGDGSGESGESSEMSKSKLTDLYKRYLLPHGYLKTAKLVPKTNFPEECTKCKKNCMNSSEMHKHMLDCGGDTTWFLTMYSSPMTIKRKWRPFGSRRKKQIGRRDVKRNIPSTPTLRSYHYQHRIRTKPGDVETIQKMLANLPEKRARRAINFDEIKTRSQATIHSNRLLRKRFKSTFSNNFLKLKNIKQKRQLKQGKKESSSKSTTDTSSENTPVGSPKRRNKLKESLQLMKEENSRDGSSENSEEAVKIQKKKVQKKKDSTENLPPTKTKVLKMEKPKVKKEISESSSEKPMTRSNNFVLPQESKTKKKTCMVKEEVLDDVESGNGSPVVENKQSKSVSKSAKKTKKTKTMESITEKRTATSENADISSNINDRDREQPIKAAKKIKIEPEVTPVSKSSSNSNSHWINAHCNPILRLKQNSKAKSELLKSIKKKVKNSRKILEKKEAEKSEGGSRRSLRIKSLHQIETDTESLAKQTPDSSKKVEGVTVEKDLKIKTVVVSLENAVPIKIINKNAKTLNIKTEKETPEETSPIVRRSLRNSVSFEDKQELQKTSESNLILFNPRSVLRRNLRNEKTDSPVLDNTDIVTPKATNVGQKNPNGKNLAESRTKSPQVSLLKKNNIQNSKVTRGVLKSEDIPTLRKLEAKKSLDLEEMPILAKVEPIRGKICSKTEKEIPVLMPVEREQKRGLQDDEELEEDTISFQVIKKRRKNSKEITPLKIVKTVESNMENGSAVGSSFRIESSESLEDASDSGKSSKRKKLSVLPPSKATEKKAKTDVKKYFLGIDPNEIDKGRSDGQDESGSDNEPLICLMNNQVTSQNRKSELIVKKEDVETEVPESQLANVGKRPIDTSTPKWDTTNEFPVSQSEKKTDRNNCTTDNTQPVSQIFRETFKLKKKTVKKKKKTVTTPTKELRVTVTLKEPILKIIKKPVTLSSEGKWSSDAPKPEKNEASVTPTNAEDVLPETKESVLPERRSRRISKETKSTNEFVIDDPLILVDELWSDLDSDSDSSKRKSKKGKKKSPKKKTNEEKKMSDVNLEELLRNFGENKEVKKTERPSVIKVIRKKKLASVVLKNRRRAAENRKEKESYKRLSLKLFRFNKTHKNFGNRGVKLSHAKKALREKLDKLQARSSNALPDLPFLAAEIKENPVQVIQCGVQKPKTKRGLKKVDVRSQNSDIHLKISLPLDAINNLPVFNNNHLTEPVLEEPKQNSPVREKIPERIKTDKDANSVIEPLSEKESQLVEDEVIVLNDDANDMKNKTKRSDVIDKIFYCEICQTYYYSSSQLKIHKLSNRHKLKESELQQSQNALVQSESSENVKVGTAEIPSCKEPVPPVENIIQESSETKTLEEEKLNDDTLEMPTLEGPFIEGPFTRLPPEPPVHGPSPPPPPASFGFTQESLKDIQKAIGCTDEEMLILTLLGENTIEIENDILDLDSCKSVPSKPSESIREKNDSGLKENDKANGAFKVDLKQRMTSALACLVNKAVFNLLQKYENAAKTAVNPEALSLLGKLSNLSRRKNVLQLNELLKKRNDGESSVNVPAKDIEKKEPAVSYKYQCTICGNRFEKASTRECHISRSHRGKAKKLAEDLQTTQVEEEWNDSWSYDVGDDHLESTTSPQFWCSDCGINFLSPQEVLDHQKVEHQTGIKDPDQSKDSGPLQSSTIGSSDEIIEGKKSRRRPKLFSSEELHQQRIIANNELRKLDRRFSNKSKSTKTKWGMDALKFTVEKENKAIVDEEEKEIVSEESLKPPMEVKNIDLVPKLNLSRISNIPEFKVIQKNSFENRFQKIIDNKLKRKCACPSQEENAADDVEEEVMLVPVVVKKKNKKQKVSKCSSKKEETGKPLDVYDFNESESEGEPAVYSHIKKPVPSPMKIKLVKEKEGPSKNKADSTTKDLAPDDYDSEDSLPLSVVKKSKPGDEDEDKDEKISEDGVEKSDGILEQVEYLIEQLENETGSLKNENIAQESEFEQESDTRQTDKSEFLKDNYPANESLRVSVANEFLEMDDILPKNSKCDKNVDKKPELQINEERIEELREQENESVLAEPESSQSTFDEEDSIPLVLISKKTDKAKFSQEIKKCDENTTDVSTTASEDVSILRVEETKSNDTRDFPTNPQTPTEESLPPVFSSSENDGAFSEKSVKAFETLNGNVIYCRNDSMTDFESDLSNDGLIDSNYEKNNSVERNFIKEITEKEDVVIVCSKAVEEESNESKISRDLEVTEQGKNTEQTDIMSKKKKRFPLLSATIEENNFRRSESPKSNKEVIVRKIWNRKKLTEDSTDNDEDSYLSMDNSTSVENLQEEESRTEIEKEIIVKKIWSRKKPELEDELPEKVEESFEDIKINQTEVSDEVVIKCGPKAKPSPKRRKSKSSNEASKDTIMRKIWSGKCTFQTKAALKTYESDVLPNCKENESLDGQSKSKRRRRPNSFSATKRTKVDSDKDDEDDDLESLLEEIEREQLEKAIRSEFLQLRRSEKGNVEMKESGAPTVGIFTETTLDPKKEISEKKRRKIKKKLKHPKQSLLKRKKIIRKPFRRVLPSEERNIRENANRLEEHMENSLDSKNVELFRGEGKMKSRKHKKHRHKHHHHKHKHKKSKHHKSAPGKHKSKHEFGEKDSIMEKTDSFTILEKICQEIPNQIESESQRSSKRRSSSESNDTDSKQEAEELFSLGEKGSNEVAEKVDFEEGLPAKRHFESINIYEFVEDVSDFSSDGLRNVKK